MSKFSVVVLGTGGVGKSALTTQFCSGTFTERYDPTIEDSYRRGIDVDGSSYVLEILDTAGTELLGSMRDLDISHGNGFLLVYSIVSSGSFYELERIHEQIVQVKGNPNVPIVLVGNKCDLEANRTIKKAEGEALAKKWNVPFVEASTNVEQTFKEVTMLIIKGKGGKEKKKGGCHIL